MRHQNIRKRQVERRHCTQTFRVVISRCITFVGTIANKVQSRWPLIAIPWVMERANAAAAAAAAHILTL